MNERERLAGWFRALAHPTRLLILDDLRDGARRSPKELTERIDGDHILAAVSHHTRVLARSGLLGEAGTRRRSAAVQHYYRISPAGIALLELVDRLDGARRTA